MSPSAKDFERAIARLREYSHSTGLEKCSPADFLDRLQAKLEWLSGYQRVAHAILKLASVLSILRVEED